MNLKMREKMLGDLTDFFTTMPDNGSDAGAKKNMKVEITSGNSDATEKDGIVPEDEIELMGKSGMRSC